jgi:type IV secretion system protein VirD4
MDRRDDVRSIVIFRSDILRYPVLASKVNYRSWWYWQWWGRYDTWPASQEVG